MMSLVQEKFQEKKKKTQPTEMQRSLCSHRHKNEEEVDATKFTVGKRKLFFPSLRSVIYSVV